MSVIVFDALLLFNNLHYMIYALLLVLIVAVQPMEEERPMDNTSVSNIETEVSSKTETQVVIVESEEAKTSTCITQVTETGANLSNCIHLHRLALLMCCFDVAKSCI